MLLRNIFSIAALAASAIASHTGTAGGSHIAHKGEKYEGYHYAGREARERYHTADHEESRERHGDKLDRRNNGGVFTCTKNNWKGTCNKYAADKKCRKWNTGPEGSLGPDKGITCLFFNESNCTGDVEVVNYPGLGTVGADVWAPDGVVNYPGSYYCKT